MSRARRWLVILSVLAGMSMLVVGAAVVLLGGSLLANSRAAPTAAELEKWIGVKVPASATGYRSYAEGFQDWMIVARFEVPASELASFLAANRLEASDRDPAYASSGPPDQPWFRPGPGAQLHARRRLPDGHPDKQPGPDPADSTTVWTEPAGDRAIVHLRTITM